MTPKVAQRMLSIAKALDEQAKRAEDLKITLSSSCAFIDAMSTFDPAQLNRDLSSRLRELATDLRRQVFVAVTSLKRKA